MEDIKLTALKELYKEQVTKLERMQEYKAEKEALLCEIAKELLKRQQKVITEDRDIQNKIRVNEEMKQRYKSFQKKNATENKVSYQESIKYKIQKDFISEIEGVLKKQGLIPDKDSQGKISFQKTGKGEGWVGVW